MQLSAPLAEDFLQTKQENLMHESEMLAHLSKHCKIHSVHSHVRVKEQLYQARSKIHLLSLQFLRAASRGYLQIMHRVTLPLHCS